MRWSRPRVRSVLIAGMMRCLFSAPFCSACGVPFEFEQGPAALCGACIRERPVFSRARAVLIYNDVSRDLVTGLKHRDRMHGAPAFGRWLARAGRELVQDADLVVPVPLHRLRLSRRRFNQSALLAQALTREAGCPEKLRAAALSRRRSTPTQGGLNASQRRLNVRGGLFVATPRYTDDLAGQHVLLIDDVYTTAATLEACTKVLLGAGGYPGRRAGSRPGRPAALETDDSVVMAARELPLVKPGRVA